MLEFSLFFLTGVLTTLSIIAIIIKYNKLSRAKAKPVRQSIIFWELKQFMPDMMNAFLNKPTQAQSYDDNRSFKFIEMPDNKAYWLDRNKIYYAEIKNDGRFDPKEGKLSEMKNLSEKQLVKMLFIYNSLKNG
jgi:hypothetical protein